MGFTIMESFMDVVKVRSTPGKGDPGDHAEADLPHRRTMNGTPTAPELLEAARQGTTGPVSRCWRKTPA